MVRDNKIDIAKAIGIILVVLGHASMPHSSIIFRFHMALFFALSGYCFSDKHIAGLKELLLYIKNKIVGLYIPYVLFNGGTYLLRNFFIRINIYTNDPRFIAEASEGNYYGLTAPLTFQELKPWLINVLKFTGDTQLGGATWFLRVLFEITILWAVINYLIATLAKADKRLRLGINVLLSGVFIGMAYFCMQNDKQLFLQFQIVMSVYSVYTFGYYLKVFKETSNRIIQNPLAAIVSFVILYYCDIQCSIRGWDSNVNVFANPFMYIATSVTGIILVLSISSILGKFKYFHFMEYIGQHTLAVLLWHFMAFKLAILIQLAIYKAPLYCLASFPVFKSTNGWWICYTVIGVSVPVFMAYLYSTVKNKVKQLWK